MKTGYSPDRERTGTNTTTSISAYSNRMDCSASSFTYSERIPVMDGVSADRSRFCPTVVLKGQRESSPNLNGVSTNFQKC